MKKKVCRNLSWAVVAAIFALPLMSLPGAVDMFLKIDDIKGESTNDKHKDEIEVLAWSWVLTQSGTTHVGDGGTAGKLAVQDLFITKWIDKTSPILMLTCAKGERFKEATLTVTRTLDGKESNYLVLKMQEVMVRGMETGGDANSLIENRMTEKITLNFARFDIEYTPVDQDGNPQVPVQMSWDIVQNTGG